MSQVYRHLKSSIFSLLISAVLFSQVWAVEISSDKQVSRESADPESILPDIQKLPFGHDYFILRSNADYSRSRFRGTGSGRVAFLGGSITHNPGWREKVCAFLVKEFPKTEFDFINAGIPSMGSTPGAFRIRRDVLSKGPVDLLFVEAAVNDSTNGRSGQEQIRGMEGIVRQAWKDNPETDIIFLYFADPEKTRLYNQGQIPDVIRNHETVASHYQISSLNLALEVTERIRTGQFSWEKDFKDLHPSPFGQILYAGSVARMLTQLWQAPLDKTGQLKPRTLPAALLDDYSYTHGRLADIRGAEIRTGWRIVENWQPDDGAATRAGFDSVPMLAATEPGAELNFPFNGRGVGLFVAAGPDSGTIEYSIDDGEVKTLDLFTRWSPGLHLPWAYLLESELEHRPEGHMLNLKTARIKNPDSSGHAVRIAHFLVNQ